MESEQINTQLKKATRPDFTIVWNNLTYKVDSRPYYTKLGERLFACRTPNADNSSQSNSSDYSQSCAGDNRERTILNHICGDAKSGELTGILGPSGAGKSTLLNCLFQNRTDGTTGQILVDRAKRSKLKVCFIPQHDYLNEWLTVREDLVFVSKLKSARIDHVPGAGGNSDNSTPPHSTNNLGETETYVKQTGTNDFNTTLIDHDANATQIADLLGLTNCLDVKIKNISGGQKKRLSIGRELMSKPDILILDEPTTGLDSLTCYKTMVVLRDLTKYSDHPMAVIITIHQPQKSVLNLFDKTYFLSNRGRVIYGDDPKKVVETLDRVAKVRLPLPKLNPAEFLIEIASNDTQGSVAELLSIHQRTEFSEKYDASYLKRLMAPKGTAVVDLNEDTQSIHLSPDAYFISYQLRNCLSSHSSSVMQSFGHIFTLTHRSWISTMRNPSLTRSRFVFHVLLPFIMLTIYGQTAGGINNCPKLDVELSMADMTKSIKDGLIARNVEEIKLAGENIAFFFMVLYGFAINIISCTASFYPLTMNIFKKETINGLYSPAPYFIGQMLAELPFEIFFPTMSMLMSYPLSGQATSYLQWRMFTVAFVVFLTCYAAHALGLLCGAMFINNVNVSIIVGQMVLFVPIMLSGFLIRIDRMPEWMRVLSYTSFFRHGLFGIVAARYGFNLCDCDEDSLPENGEIKFSGMTSNVKHVLEYMFPRNSSSDENFDINEVFDQLGRRFVKAQTFALEINSCEEVRPYPMHMFSIHDSDIYVAVIGLLVTICTLKLVTFSVMKSFPHRII